MNEITQKCESCKEKQREVERLRVELEGQFGGYRMAADEATELRLNNDLLAKSNEELLGLLKPLQAQVEGYKRTIEARNISGEKAVKLLNENKAQV